MRGFIIGALFAIACFMGIIMAQLQLIETNTRQHSSPTPAACKLT